MNQDSSQPQAAAIRVGNAERERAATALGEHFAAGRLDADEYDERVRRAYEAKTAGELAQLFTDLPRAARPEPPRPAARSPRPPLAALILLILLVSAVWVLIAHVPPFFIVPLLVFVIVRRRYRRAAWR
jgi:hypothetical protein